MLTFWILEILKFLIRLGLVKVELWETCCKHFLQRILSFLVKIRSSDRWYCLLISRQKYGGLFKLFLEKLFITFIIRFEISYFVARTVRWTKMITFDLFFLVFLFYHLAWWLWHLMTPGAIGVLIFLWIGWVFTAKNIEATLVLARRLRRLVLHLLREFFFGLLYALWKSIICLFNLFLWLLDGLRLLWLFIIRFVVPLLHYSNIIK